MIWLGEVVPGEAGAGRWRRPRPGPLRSPDGSGRPPARCCSPRWLRLHGPVTTGGSWRRRGGALPTTVADDDERGRRQHHQQHRHGDRGKAAHPRDADGYRQPPHPTPTGGEQALAFHGQLAKSGDAEPAEDPSEQLVLGPVDTHRIGGQRGPSTPPARSIAPRIRRCTSAAISRVSAAMRLRMPRLLLVQRREPLVDGRTTGDRPRSAGSGSLPLLAPVRLEQPPGLVELVLVLGDLGVDRLLLACGVGRSPPSSCGAALVGVGHAGDAAAGLEGALAFGHGQRLLRLVELLAPVELLVEVRGDATDDGTVGAPPNPGVRFVGAQLVDPAPRRGGRVGRACGFR